MNYVYHGSSISNLKVIKVDKSHVSRKWIYASASRAVATIFLSKNANDLYYFLGGSGKPNDPLMLVERKPNMFDRMFHVSGSIYKLSADNFCKNKTGWSTEVVSEEDELVLEERKIEDAYIELLKLNDIHELDLYFYPDRPSFIPIDNSDLIPKVIKWVKNGFDVENFFKLYPELKEKYFEELEKD